MNLDKAPELGEELQRLLGAAIKRTGGSFPTLGKTPAPNEVVSFEPAGLWVMTGRAADQETPKPKLIPAWMFELAWRELKARGRLSNKTLLKELRVCRSSAVCAILGKVEGVRVEPGIVLVAPGVA